MDLKEESLLGDAVHRHWYYRSKLEALLRLTADLPPGVVMDVGAGSGFFSRSLLERGRMARAICVDPGYPADREETVAGRSLVFCRSIPERADEVGLVLMMDVMEHIEDDLGFAQDYVSRIGSGTRVLVTVPAFRWLWSGHDVFLEHYRRYTLPQLERVLRQAGLEIELGSYYFGAVLPIAASVRLGRKMLGGKDEPKSDMRVFGPVLNTLFSVACQAELPFLRHNRVGGLSVFARAVKP